MPQREGADSPAGVEFVRPVPGAENAGFAAGARAAIAYAVAIEKRHARAGAAKIARRPSPEHASADHGEIESPSRRHFTARW